MHRLGEKTLYGHASVLVRLLCRALDARLGSYVLRFDYIDWGFQGQQEVICAMPLPSTAPVAVEWNICWSNWRVFLRVFSHTWPCLCSLKGGSSTCMDGNIVKMLRRTISRSNNFVALTTCRGHFFLYILFYFISPCFVAGSNCYFFAFSWKFWSFARISVASLPERLPCSL